MNIDKTLKKIKEAHDRREALKYYKLYNRLRSKINISIEDEDLYSLGQAEYEQRNRRKRDNPEDSAIEKMVDEVTEKGKIHRMGFWNEFYDLVEREMKQKNNVTGEVHCPSRLIEHLGDEKAFTVIYNFFGKNFYDRYVNDGLTQKTALDKASENLDYYMKPYSVKETKREGSTSHIQIGNFKPKPVNDAYEMFEREISRRSIYRIPDMRRVLEKYWPDYYGKGGKKDLSKVDGLTIIRCYRSRERKARKRKR